MGLSKLCWNCDDAVLDGLLPAPLPLPQPRLLEMRCVVSLDRHLKRSQSFSETGGLVAAIVVEVPPHGVVLAARANQQKPGV